MENNGTAPDRLPLAALVSGAPGSGKSTLAAALGTGLDVPVLHKDPLVHGIWRTRDRALELGAPGVEPFFRTMELWAQLGVSFVAEQTFYRGVSEPDVARRLARAASSSTSTAGARTDSSASSAGGVPTPCAARNGSASCSRWPSDCRPSSVSHWPSSARASAPVASTSAGCP